MRSFTALPCLLLVPVLIAAPPSTRSWGDLAQTVRPDWTVRLVLPDGTTVEGQSAIFEPNALLMHVVRTSNKSLHPKGSMTIPRDQVRTVEIRQNRHKARRIGALVPVAAGLAVGYGLAASVSGDSSCRVSSFLCGVAVAAGAGIGLGIAAVGGTTGYFIGRSVDRRFETVTVTGP